MQPLFPIKNIESQNVLKSSFVSPNTEAHYQKKHDELNRQYEKQKLELIEFKAQAHYWKAQFEQLKIRHDELESKVEKLIADLKKRENQLFGKRSENYPKKKSEQNNDEDSARSRGQQYGSIGHGRREYENLPKIDELISLSEKDKYCPCCGLPYKELSDTEDSEVIEINVNAYTRAIKRKKYRRCCNCKDNNIAEIITAPMEGKLLPRSKIGVTIWTFLLLNKYEYKQPINRSLEQLTNNGLSLAVGTLTDGFQKLVPLFADVYDAIEKRSLESNHWHADETRWKVYEKIEDKNNTNWYLWIFHNKETVIFKIAPTRSTNVLTEHFGKDHQGGTLNVDRYSAYKAIAKEGLFILAFCWAHVRRDFLSHGKGYPEMENWGLSWIDDIAKLYHINNLRMQYNEKTRLFRQYHGQLKKAIAQMRERLSKELTDKSIVMSKKKILKSLDNHWSGLTIFVNYPQIPMDNNLAERGLRPSVVGRKNYYGSGVVWSSKLAAYLFTIFSTIKLHGINPQTWLLGYLQECVYCGGKAPPNIDKFLPWKMSDEIKKFFREPPNIQFPFA